MFHSKNLIDDQENKYFDLLKNKDIILVGPSSYLIGKNKGREIDEYDLIARMNFSIPTKEEMKIDLGSRTDILYKRLLKRINKQGDYFPTKEEIKSWKNDKLKWVVVIATSNMSKGTKFGEINKFFPWTVTGKVKGEIKKASGVKQIFAGLISAVHILKSKAKSLTITNCTFYNTGYYDSYRGLIGKDASEDTDRKDFEVLTQLKFLNNLRKSDSRLIFDECLEEIIRQNRL